jgi:protein-tyrosine phosphatase
LRKEIYWIDGFEPGKLAVAPRPRGGEWLEDDIGNWKREGVHEVLSLLTREEENDLRLQGESAEVVKNGMEFVAFPIADRQVPQSQAQFAEILDKVSGDLTRGRSVLVHCRQGIGRSGLMAACLLVKAGVSPGAAIDMVSAARGLAVPETAEQKEWIERYAASLSILR